MNIGIFFTFGYSLRTWNDSGTINRELEIFNKIKDKKNVNFKLFTYGNIEDLKYKDLTNDLEVVPIYMNSKIPNNKILRYIHSIFIPIILKKELKDIDIIHQNQLLGSWVSILCSLIYKKPLFIRTGYDMYRFSIFEKKNIFITYLYKTLTSFSLKLTNLYSVTNIPDYNFLNNKFNIESKKIVIRPNWVAQKSCLENKRYQNRILTVGRLCYQKNFSYLIKEFKNTKDSLIIDIVGSGDKKNELIALSNKYSVNVNFIDNITNEQLMDLYPKYNFFISTSLYEGHPKSLLEAMSSGCIVFVSNIENHINIVKNLKNGIIFNLTKNKLNETFLKYKNDKQLLNLIRENSIVDIKKNFNIENLIEDFYVDYLNLYNTSNKK